MATKKTTKAKSSNKKKKGGKLASVFTVIVVIAAIAWYVCGKPAISMQEDSFDFAIYLTEEPLWKQFLNDPEAVIAKETGVDLSWKEEKPSPSAPSASVSTGSSANNITEHDQNHAENTGLYLGNPSDAIASKSSGTNYLMEKPQFTISYNNEKYIPNWVAWHLQTSDIGKADRLMISVLMMNCQRTGMVSKKLIINITNMVLIVVTFVLLQIELQVKKTIV